MKIDKTMRCGSYTLHSIAKLKGINSSDPQQALGKAGYRILYNYDNNGNKLFKVTEKVIKAR